VKDEIRNAYTAVAVSYAEILPDTRYEAPLDLAMLRQFLDLLGPDANDVLDAGCGTGRMTAYLHSLAPGLTIDGVDLSPGMLEQARSTYPDGRFVEGDLAALPYGDGSFDGVLAWYSIIHTPAEDVGVILAEMRRVLRPGGVALIGFQAGVGERVIQHAYGHDVSMVAFLHTTAHIAESLLGIGMSIDAVLDRAPRGPERHGQGFVLATKREDTI
jgi:ubiquinone/menaquinone biosynthesis C-methylase UbiE